MFHVCVLMCLLCTVVMATFCETWWCLFVFACLWMTSWKGLPPSLLPSGISERQLCLGCEEVPLCPRSALQGHRTQTHGVHQGCQAERRKAAHCQQAIHCCQSHSQAYYKPLKWQGDMFWSCVLLHVTVYGMWYEHRLQNYFKECISFITQTSL